MRSSWYIVYECDDMFALLCCTAISHMCHCVVLKALSIKAWLCKTHQIVVTAGSVSYAECDGGAAAALLLSGFGVRVTACKR